MFLVAVAMIGASLVGCAGGSKEPETEPLATPDANRETMGGLTIQDAPLDTIQPVVLSDEPIVMLPVGPDGYASLEDL